MSKKITEIESVVMSQIAAGKVAMKPRWWFALGSIALIVGIVGTATMAIFASSFISFALRSHGPMKDYRLQEMMSGFPWWAVVFGLLGIITSIYLLKKYDFSYKRNFKAYILLFIAGVLLIGFVINMIGIDRVWMNQGVMRGMYGKYGLNHEDGRGQRRLDGMGKHMQRFNFN